MNAEILKSIRAGKNGALAASITSRRAVLEAIKSSAKSVEGKFPSVRIANNLRGDSNVGHWNLGYHPGSKEAPATITFFAPGTGYSSSNPGRIVLGSKDAVMSVDGILRDNEESIRKDESAVRFREERAAEADAAVAAAMEGFALATAELNRVLTELDDPDAAAIRAAVGLPSV